jgi:hypothetical protein
MIGQVVGGAGGHGHDRQGRVGAALGGHAIHGFTSSLRCELLHDHSGVWVTVVQMPAVNTPQFSWVRSPLLGALLAAPLPSRLASG